MAQKTIVVQVQDKAFNSFADNMIKLSLVSTVCKLGPALSFF